MEEPRIDAILEHGRRTRQPLSRGVWIASAIIATLCLVAFVLMLVAEPAPSVAPSTARDESSGFVSGILVGGAAGIAVGFLLARRRHSSGSELDHSSRKMP